MRVVSNLVHLHRLEMVQRMVILLRYHIAVFCAVVCTYLHWVRLLFFFCKVLLKHLKIYNFGFFGLRFLTHLLQWLLRLTLPISRSRLRSLDAFSSLVTFQLALIGVLAVYHQFAGNHSLHFLSTGSSDHALSQVLQEADHAGLAFLDNIYFSISSL